MKYGYVLKKNKGGRSPQKREIEIFYKIFLFYIGEKNEFECVY